MALEVTPPLDIYPKEVKTHAHPKGLIPRKLLQIAKNWNYPKCLLTTAWVSILPWRHTQWHATPRGWYTQWGLPLSQVPANVLQASEVENGQRLEEFQEALKKEARLPRTDCQ